MICSKLRTQMACHCEMVKSGRADACRCQACNKRRKRRLKGSEKGARPAPRAKAPARAVAQLPPAAPASRPRRRASMHPPKYSAPSDEDENESGVGGAWPAHHMHPVKRRRQGDGSVTVHASLMGKRQPHVTVGLVRGEPWSDALHSIRGALKLPVQPVRVFDGASGAHVTASDSLFHGMSLQVVPVPHDGVGAGKAPMGGSSRLGSLVSAAASSREASREASRESPVSPVPPVPPLSRGRSEEEVSAAEVLQSLPRLGSSSGDGPGAGPTLSARPSSDSNSGSGPRADGAPLAADIRSAVLGGTPCPTWSRQNSQTSLGPLGGFPFTDDEEDIDIKPESLAGLGKHPIPPTSGALPGTAIGGRGVAQAPSLSPVVPPPIPFSRDAGTGGEGLNKLPLQQVTLARVQSISYLQPASQPGRA